jgi:hypothetical protein
MINPGDEVNTFQGKVNVIDGPAIWLPPPPCHEEAHAKQSKNSNRNERTMLLKRKNARESVERHINARNATEWLVMAAFFATIAARPLGLTKHRVRSCVRAVPLFPSGTMSSAGREVMFLWLYG